MRAVVLQEFGNPSALTVKTIPIPQPMKGQVLVRMEASPINPGDLVFLNGGYATDKPLPCVPGFEGSGTVVANGGGLLGWYLSGKRVACASGFNSPHGCWAEYMATDATHCVELPANVSFEQGSCFFGNPLTAVMFLDSVKCGKHAAVIQSAAASALGKMFLKLCLQERIPLVNIVRRPEQVHTLQALGAEFVLNSQEPDFESELKGLCKQLGASVGFDCVSGSVTGQMLEALMPGAVLYICGALSGAPSTGFIAQDFIFLKKKVEGLNLRHWLESASSYKKLKAIRQVSKQLTTIFSTEVVQRFCLEELGQAVDLYSASMSAGKVILIPRALPTLR